MRKRIVFMLCFCLLTLCCTSAKDPLDEAYDDNEEPTEEHEPTEELEPTEGTPFSPELGEEESHHDHGAATHGTASKRRRSRKGKKYYKRRYKAIKKSKKEKMKCSMMAKKEESLASQFNTVWKHLQTMQEELIRVQKGTGLEDSRLPLECHIMGRNETNCRMDENALPCSGKGFCSCGFCVCNPQYQGQFCECEPCGIQNHVECGGRHRGACECGKCACKPGFQGTNCECSIDDDDTTECEDHDGVVCSGNGECVCKSCKCHEGYQGNLCNLSPSSSNACEELERCIICDIFGVSDPKCSSCDLEISMVDRLDVTEGRQSCSVGADKGCVLMFTYTEPQDDNEKTQVELQNFSCNSKFRKHKKH